LHKSDICQGFQSIAQKSSKLVPQPTKLEIAEQNTAITYFLSPTMTQTLENLSAIDDNLSKRHLDLDPGGYFIIYIDRETSSICAKHFTNIIDDRGLAVDPETGQPIPARGKVERTQCTLFSGRTAKELCVKILEETRPSPVTMFDHAAYLGREFVRAEIALLSDREYVQD
jgi:dihydropteroate synthase